MRNRWLRASWIGGLDVIAAARTPGKVCVRSSARCQYATAAGKSRPPSDAVSNRFAVSIPLGVARRCSRLRTSRPAPIRSTSVMASSATISSRRARRRFGPLLVVGPDAFNAPLRSIREA